MAVYLPILCCATMRVAGAVLYRLPDKISIRHRVRKNLLPIRRKKPHCLPQIIISVLEIWLSRPLGSCSKCRAVSRGQRTRQRPDEFCVCSSRKRWDIRPRFPVSPAKKRAPLGWCLYLTPTSVLCSSSPPLTRFTTTATMPSTVRSRAPAQKALSIGIEYRELAERFPQSQLSLPAAHKDPVIMSRLLQGGPHGYWSSTAVLTFPCF